VPCSKNSQIWLFYKFISGHSPHRKIEISESWHKFRVNWLVSPGQPYTLAWSGPRGVDIFNERDTHVAGVSACEAVGTSPACNFDSRQCTPPFIQPAFGLDPHLTFDLLLTHGSSRIRGRSSLKRFRHWISTHDIAPPPPSPRSSLKGRCKQAVPAFWLHPSVSNRASNLFRQLSKGTLLDTGFSQNSEFSQDQGLSQKDLGPEQFWTGITSYAIILVQVVQWTLLWCVLFSNSVTENLVTLFVQIFRAIIALLYTPIGKWTSKQKWTHVRKALGLGPKNTIPYLPNWKSTLESEWLKKRWIESMDKNRLSFPWRLCHLWTAGQWIEWQCKQIVSTGP